MKSRLLSVEQIHGIYRTVRGWAVICMVLVLLSRGPLWSVAAAFLLAVPWIEGFAARRGAVDGEELMPLWWIYRGDPRAPLLLVLSGTFLFLWACVRATVASFAGFVPYAAVAAFVVWRQYGAPVRASPRAIFGSVFFAIVYGFSASVVVNQLADFSAPRAVRLTVIHAPGSDRYVDRWEYQVSAVGPFDGGRGMLLLPWEGSPRVGDVLPARWGSGLFGVAWLRLGP